MQRMILGAAMLAASLDPLPAGAAEACHDYAARLAAMADADQGLRKRIDYLDPDSRQQQTLSSHVRLVDRSNTERFKSLAGRCGWPTKAAHGERALEQAWLLVGRAGHDLAFQKQALALAEDAATASGEGLSRSYAYLYDQVALAEGRPQHYGTQLDAPPGQACALFFRPFDSRARFEERRARLNMAPLDEYLRLAKDMRHCTDPKHYVSPAVQAAITRK